MEKIFSVDKRISRYFCLFVYLTSRNLWPHIKMISRNKNEILFADGNGWVWVYEQNMYFLPVWDVVVFSCQWIQQPYMITNFASALLNIFSPFHFMKDNFVKPLLLDLQLARIILAEISIIRSYNRSIGTPKSSLMFS